MTKLLATALYDRGMLVQARMFERIDPKDDKFLDVALNGGAQMIVTGDQDLLVLHPFQGIEILKPADFLDRVAR